MIDEELLSEKMHVAYKSWGIAAMVIICVSICFPPAGNFLGPLLLIQPTKVTLEANQVLSSKTIFKIPEWINDCSREDQLIGTEQINTELIENTVSKINSLSKCLVAYHFLCAIALIFLIWFGCAFLYFERNKN